MRRVLYAVLDWGLGHATRSIPIIQELQAQQFEVAIAGSGESLELLRREFPGVMFHELPGYQPRYAASGKMALAMLRQLPHFIGTIRAEHRKLQSILDQQRFDVVVSDNRYGCWSRELPSIFITHQSNIQMPRRFGWLAPLVRQVTYRLLRNFSECWVPDLRNALLTGKLSEFAHLKNIPVTFIGPLSRFRYTGPTQYKFEILAVFSGPEPQRTILENIVLESLQNSNKSFFVVRGLPFDSKSYKEYNIVNFADMQTLSQLMNSSEIVIARSGYSTVMDLIALRKKAILIPTPGQTEQEYLAALLHQKAWFYSTEQDRFNLSSAVAGVYDCNLPSDVVLSVNSEVKDAICKLRARFQD